MNWIRFFLFDSKHWRKSDHRAGIVLERLPKLTKTKPKALHLNPLLYLGFVGCAWFLSRSFLPS